MTICRRRSSIECNNSLDMEKKQRKWERERGSTRCVGMQNISIYADRSHLLYWLLRSNLDKTRGLSYRGASANSEAMLRPFHIYAISPLAFFLVALNWVLNDSTNFFLNHFKTFRFDYSLKLFVLEHIIDHLICTTCSP